MNNNESFDQNKKPVEHVCSNNNKTKQKAHSLTQNKFRTIFDNAPFGVIVADKNYKVINCNKNCQQIFNYSQSKAKQISILDLFHPTQIRIIKEALNNIKTGKSKTYKSTCKIITQNNLSLWANIAINQVNDPYKEFIVMIENITDNNYTQSALAESEHKLDTIFNESPVAIALVDLKFRILKANKSYCRMLGYTEEELKTKSIENITYKEDIENDKELQKQLSSGKINIYRLEKRFVHKNGNIINGLLVASLIKDRSNKPLYFLRQVIDTTEQKRIEQQLSESEKLRSIGQLAGGIAHDFNNQLSVILGYADMLKHKLESNSSLKKYTQNIITSVERSAKLTSQLLAFARKGKYLSIVININELINKTITLLKHSIEKNITIRKRYSKSDLYIKGDTSLLQSALLNIALNAKDAMPNGGIINFCTKKTSINQDFISANAFDIEPGMYAQIIISDNGDGIPDEYKKKIFEPFFTTKNLGEGKGMGLPAAFGTVKSHKGAITFKSSKNKGTDFIIYLPLTKKEETVKTKKKISFNKKQVKFKNILLVDDEKMLLEMGTHILKSLGCTVAACKNGKEGVEYYKEFTKEIDLVILDLIMPIMDGKAAFYKMKEINPDVNIILSSGYSLNEEAEMLLNDGAKTFIQKPFKKSDIIDAFNKINLE